MNSTVPSSTSLPSNRSIGSDVESPGKLNASTTATAAAYEDDEAEDVQLTKEFTIKTIKSGKNNDSVMRAALRLAARQGLEAMIDLYDKKEPNLLKKGERKGVD